MVVDPRSPILDPCVATCANPAHESRGYLQARLDALALLLRTASPRDLTLVEYAAMVPRRAPVGCRQQRLRDRILQILDEAGFTMQGERVR